MQTVDQEDIPGIQRTEAGDSTVVAELKPFYSSI